LACSWLERVLPAVVRLAEARRERTVFTRFVPPERPEDAAGAWRRYYAHWRDMTGDRLDPHLIQLVPPLASLAPPAIVIDKAHYSPFKEPALRQALRQLGADALVITGGETDVCVLAAVMDAVDASFRVVLAADALCSVSDESHDAVLRHFGSRFSEQIEVASINEILACAVSAPEHGLSISRAKDCSQRNWGKMANRISAAFDRAAQWAARECGRAHTFAIAIIVVIVWAVSGPLFGFSDTWQLVINTGTTIVTLMVFLIQNTQNRDTEAMQLKIDELLRVTERARNRLITLEDLTEEELDRVKQELTKVAQAEKDDPNSLSHRGSPDR
jgi:low affinity Fe/Cu permease/nicotinamidase-related amidase